MPWIITITDVAQSAKAVELDVTQAHAAKEAKSDAEKTDACTCRIEADEKRIDFAIACSCACNWHALVCAALPCTSSICLLFITACFYFFVLILKCRIALHAHMYFHTLLTLCMLLHAKYLCISTEIFHAFACKVHVHMYCACKWPAQYTNFACKNWCAFNVHAISMHNS